jgi:hypothetical protein
MNFRLEHDLFHAGFRSIGLQDVQAQPAHLEPSPKSHVVIGADLSGRNDDLSRRIVAVQTAHGAGIPFEDGALPLL